MTNKYIYIFIFFLSIQFIYSQSYEEFIVKSYEYSDSSNFPAAEEALKAAMRLAPANPLNFALLTNLGTIQRRQGKLDDALISYTAALSQQPNDEVILMNRADLFTEMNETEKAINDYNTLLVKIPEHEKALYYRGLLYIKTGEFLLAETDFEHIIDKYKDTFFGRLGYAILEKARGKYVESEIIFNYLTDKYPNNTRVLEERAELYFLTKRNARAMADLNKIFAAIKEPSAEMYMLRGRVKLAQYEKASAALDFRKAAELGYDKETVDKLIKKAY
ncbi:MAG: tetratricopeptide repeat protein [Tannerella sp.]|jgi:tetratricopeptide (TPR) repeat protein|nr:tetratricopeptide repeat protein [Tannerella sp.]